MVRRHKVRGLIWISTGIVPVLLSGCSAGSEGQAGGDTLTYALPDDPGNLDPALMINGSAIRLSWFAYDSLLYQDKNGTAIPGLAKSWKVSADSVTFRLRTDVTCADGSKLTSADVAANFEHIKDPAAKSPWYNTLLTGVPFTVSSGKADNTVTVKAKQPYGNLLLGTGSLPIVCGKGLKDRTSLKNGFSGTGPYTLSSSQPGSRYVLKKRDEYTWGPDGAGSGSLPKQIEFKVIDDNTTAANLLSTGGLDIGVVSGADAARLDQQKLFSKSGYSTLGTLYFNEKSGHPTESAKLRRALAMALDRQALTKVAADGRGRVAQNLMPSGPCPGDTVSGHLPKADLKAARDLVSSVTGGKRLSLKLNYQTAGGGTAAAVELLTKQWAAIGVDAKVTPQSNTELTGTLFGGAGNWDVYWTYIHTSLPSQFVGFFSGQAPPHGTNFGSVQNRRYQELAGKARVMTSAPEACKVWNEAESALFTGPDVVPVADQKATVYGSKGTTFSTDVKNVFFYAGMPSPTSIRIG